MKILKFSGRNIKNVTPKIEEAIPNTQPKDLVVNFLGNFFIIGLDSLCSHEFRRNLFSRASIAAVHCINSIVLSFMYSTLNLQKVKNHHLTVFFRSNMM